MNVNLKDYLTDEEIENIVKEEFRIYVRSLVKKDTKGFIIGTDNLTELKTSNSCNKSTNTPYQELRDSVKNTAQLLEEIDIKNTREYHLSKVISGNPSECRKLATYLWVYS